MTASNTLPDNNAWLEICTLIRFNAHLAFNPASPITAQLYLPETLHALTMLVGSGTTSIRLTLYQLFINTLRTLAGATPHGDMDTPGLTELLSKAQEAPMLAIFGLARLGAGSELVGSGKEEGELAGLKHVQDLAEFLEEVVISAATSTGTSTHDLSIQGPFELTSRLQQRLARPLDGFRRRNLFPA